MTGLSTSVVDYYVADISWRIRANDALGGNDLADKGVLLFCEVEGKVCLIPIRIRFKKGKVFAFCWKSRPGRSRRTLSRK